jgi:hypothetical protein
MKSIPTFEDFINEAKMESFPEYNNGKDSNSYMKDILKNLSIVTGLDVEHNYMDTTSAIHLKSKPGMFEFDLTKDIQKALKGFDDNLNLDSITTNLGKPMRISQNDSDKGIVSYTIPKKVDWWTLKRAAGTEKPSMETQLTSEIVYSLLDKMAAVSTTQDELADIKWTSLEDFLKSAEDHISSTNYKKFYKEVKKKYPKMK